MKTSLSRLLSPKSCSEEDVLSFDFRGVSIAIFAFFGSAQLLLALPAEETAEPFSAPPAVRVDKPAGKRLKPVLDPASRNAVAHRNLRDDCSAAEISRFSGFPEPLKPMGDASVDPATSAMAQLVNRWAVRGDPDDFSLLIDFIKNYPSSVWTPGVRFNLGKIVTIQEQNPRAGLRMRI